MSRQLSDITSKKFLDQALKNAKLWCQSNLTKYLEGFKGNIDYSIFTYAIRDSSGPDMCLDKKTSGLVIVSTKTIEWYLKREEAFKRGKLRFRQPVEIDPESMFVHEITEYILYRPDLFNIDIWFQKYFGREHETARKIENINRRDRGLEDWPEF